MALQEHRDLVAITVATEHPEQPEHRENRDLWDPRALMALKDQKVIQDHKAHPVREGRETIALVFTEILHKEGPKMQIVTCPSLT